MRYIVLASLVVAVLLGLAGAGLAQDHFHHRIMAPEGAGPHIAFMMAHGHLSGELGLTEEQKTAVKQLHEELAAKAHPIMDQHQKQMEEIETLLDAGNVDAQEIGTKVIAAHATREQLQAIFTEGKERFTALLTEEQRAKLEKIEQEHPLPEKRMMFFHHGS